MKTVSELLEDAINDAMRLQNKLLALQLRLKHDEPPEPLQVLDRKNLKGEPVTLFADE